jgi:hypothetical protein
MPSNIGSAICALTLGGPSCSMLGGDSARRAHLDPPVRHFREKLRACKYSPFRYDFAASPAPRDCLLNLLLTF